MFYDKSWIYPFKPVPYVRILALSKLEAFTEDTLTSIFSFSHNVFKRHFPHVRKSSYCVKKGQYFTSRASVS